ncbi:conjugal transfer protein TraN [Escherichia coli]|uniref:conjugal transfer protein TraN n=1 Tax=Escherichia coli TaxID=562 RepID=UPI003F886CBF
MKRILPLILALVAGMAQADSNSDYRAGSDFAHQIKGQGSSSIQGFKPQESIPGYNANPDETKYYGGVTAGGDGGLKNDGTTEWATGETGKTITESFMNKPKDILSPDAPFIQTGRDVVSCWAYRDTYVTQSADKGTCQTYTDNPACTLVSHQCAFYSEEGACLHEYATYSCESKTSGKVMVCGGDVFCLDGECDKAQSGQSNDFAEAVSQLAALAAAGKDVAALNGVDVRAFTGQAKFCKKAAAGYSNCCKDSGWGQDIGLARCSSDEKALAKAKSNKLTVSVGEFCSKKVLGVCLEKKRSYCQFDSKLAQIVQQQGRNGQLRISFGSAKHPDCRGITVDELQKIQFDRLDFTNFYEDLMNNQKIPDSGVLTQKVKEQIADQLKQAGQ